jgi:hypothetical protein
MLTLDKLPEGFIITSNQKDTVGYLPIVLTKFNELQQTADGDDVYHHIKNGSKIVIAQQDQIDFSALSEEEQKEIGWFDVEQWAWDNPCLSRKEVYTLFNEVFKDRRIEGAYQISASKEVYKFNTELRTLARRKAQELLSDRRFTLEDIRKAWKEGYNERNLDDYIQSLSQPKSWEIEVEMETISLSQNQGFNMGAVSSDFQIQPKFTNEKIKILKIK